VKQREPEVGVKSSISYKELRIMQSNVTSRKEKGEIPAEGKKTEKKKKGLLYQKKGEKESVKRRVGDHQRGSNFEKNTSRRFSSGLLYRKCR